MLKKQYICYTREERRRIKQTSSLIGIGFRVGPTSHLLAIFGQLKRFTTDMYICSHIGGDVFTASSKEKNFQAKSRKIVNHLQLPLQNLYHYFTEIEWQELDEKLWVLDTFGDLTPACRIRFESRSLSITKWWAWAVCYLSPLDDMGVLDWSFLCSGLERSGHEDFQLFNTHDFLPSSV